MRVHAVAFLVVHSAVSALPVAAQVYSQEVEAAASHLFDTTMSPFCPGRTLTTCPSPQAAELKKEIKAQLAAGVTPDSIGKALYAVYGDIVLAAPAGRGFGLVAWVAPFLALVAGLGIVVVRLRRSTNAEPAAPAPELSETDRQRLDAELSRL